MKHHLLRLHRWSWYALALLLLLLALTLGSARMWMPQLQSYRTDLASLIGGVLHQPITIQQMHTRFDAGRPYLQLSGVELLDAAGQPVAELQEMQLSVDLLSSLRRWEWTLHELTLVGASLHLVLEGGELRILGLALESEMASPTSEAQVESGIGNWLLAQGRLRIRDSELYLEGAQRLQQRLRIRDLKLQRSADGHWLEGTLGLSQRESELQLKLELTGDPLRDTQWQARFHLLAEQLQPAEWLPGELAGIRLHDGQLDTELWGLWRGASLESLTARVTAHHVTLEGREHRLRLNELKGLGHWQRERDGWRLQLSDFSLAQGGVTWPSSAHEVRVGSVGVELRSELLQLESLRAAALLSPDLPESAHLALQGLDPKGQLRRVRALLPEQGHPRFQAELESTSVSAWEEVPAIRGLSGEVRAAEGRGELQLRGRDGVVDLRHLFRQPLAFAQLDGLLSFSHGTEGWQLRSEHLAIANRDIQGEVRLDLSLPEQGSPYLDLYGEFADGKASSTSRYLPAHIMPPGSVDWLDGAFRAGRVTRGGVLFHGRLSDFPFAHHEGRFEVRFNVEGVQLHYQPDWPDLHEVQGEVSFINGGMYILADSARLYDSAVGRTEVVIEDLATGRLQISGQARPGAADLMRLLHESPLERPVGRYLEGLEMAGSTTLDLQLQIPLNPAQAQRHPLSVSGQVALKGARVAVSKRIALERAEGVVRFNEQGVESDELRGRLFGEEARIELHTRNKPTPHTLVELSGRASGERLASTLGLGVLASLHGPLDWQAKVAVSAGEQQGAVLEIRSDLQGVSAALPAPLGKSAVSTRPLEVKLGLSGPQRGRLQIAYSEGVQALLQLSPEGGVERGELHFGSNAVKALPERPLLRIRGQLIGLAQSQLGHRGAEGEETPLPELDIHLTRLKLLSGDEEEVATSATPVTRLPAISFKVDRLELDETDLGKLSVKIAPDGQRMRLEELRLSASDYRLHGRGDWGLVSPVRSRLELTGSCENISDLLKRLGFVSVFSSGVGVISGRFQWPGGPSAFDLAEVDGSLEMSIEQGRIDVVEPGPGRLLGIFSIAALPRRLALDFSDVFGKGFGFDRIGGTLHFTGGNAFTDDLHLEGVAANIMVTGRSGLVKQDFDQLVSVVPHISNTLPVAGGLAWGLQVGAALLVLKEMMLDDIDAAVMTQYRLQGSWQVPVITRLKQSVPTDELPTDGGQSSR